MIKAYFLKILLIIFMLLTACVRQNRPEATDSFNFFSNDVIRPEVVNPARTDNNDSFEIVIGTRMGQGLFFPAYLLSTYDKFVTDLVFESLYKFNGLTARYDAVLAEGEPEVDSSGTVYTIKLKDNSCFADGTPLTAGDVVFSYTMLADSSYTGPLSAFVQNIAGYEEYNNGAADTIRGLEILNDYRLRIIFKESGLKNRAFLELPVVSARYYNYPRGRLPQLRPLFGKPLGSGPYMLEAYHPEGAVILKKNPLYRKVLPAGTASRLTALAVTPQAEIHMLLSGTVDMLPGVNQPAKIERALKSGYINRSFYPRAGYTVLQFNMNEEPVRDVRVRQALNYGFNRAFYQQVYLGPLAIDLPAPVNPQWLDDMPDAAQKLNYYLYNPETAGRLLDEAGWRLNAEGIRVKEGRPLVINWLAVKESAVTETAVPILIQNMKELGIKLNISFVDNNTLADALYNKRQGFHLASVSLFEEALPYFITGHWHSRYSVKGGQNTANLNDEENDRLLEAFDKAHNETEMRRLFADWLVHFNTLAPAIILHSSFYFDLYNNRLNNVRTTSVFTWRDNLPQITAGAR